MPLSPLKAFLAALTPTERQQVNRLTTPAKIQAFLDDIPYSAEERYRSPLTVLRERCGHCFDGALFAAAMLRRLGHKPRIIDLLPNARDDDHVLALFQRDGLWGALAKSNFAGLRYREPIHRTLRELVLSYFEQYYNIQGEKTLRGYTVPLNLAAYDRVDWMTSDARLDDIGVRLGQIRTVKLLTPRQVAALVRVDQRSYDAGMLGANQAGLYKPPG